MSRIAACAGQTDEPALGRAMTLLRCARNARHAPTVTLYSCQSEFTRLLLV
jgi:hypothetical protein